MYRFLRWYKEQDRFVKLLFVFSSCIFLCLLFFAVAACAGSFIAAFQEIIGEKQSIWYYGLKSPKGKPITFVSYVILLIIVIISITLTYRNRVKASDERGVHFMQDSTYGSSRWMDSNEAKDVFDVSDINSTTTTIYGQLTEDGRDVVGWKRNKQGGEGNRNVILLASMGSGKSFGYVRTELIQSILRGDSFVVTDPSAELYTDIADFAKGMGLDVRVLNLADPRYSEFWNCLSETIDPETERLDSTRLNDFASIYMQNSGEEGDVFWFNAAQNLLKAVIGYAAYKSEASELDAYISLYKKVQGLNSFGDDNTTWKMKNEYVPFPWCRAKIKEAALDSGCDIKNIEAVLSDIKSYTRGAYTIGKVYDYLLNFNDISEELSQIPNYHPAKTAFLTYNTNDTEIVRKSALQGIQLRFQLFTDVRLKEVLSHDGINLSEIIQKQTACFVIMSDKSQATKPIASLFFSFLFKDVQDVYDRYAQLSKEKGVPNPCLPLVTMLDEFFSIGIIGGSPESFGTTMSNSRKRHIYISIIVQVYSQIEALYGSQIRDVIQGGCSTLLYMGGNDPSTCEFISEFASGESTVLSESHKRPIGLLNRGNPTDLTVKSDRRFLLTIDEARRWKNEVLVVRQGEYPLRLKPFPWTEHPMYKKGLMDATSIYTSIKPIEIRLDEESGKSIVSDPKSFINERIMSLRLPPKTANGDNKENVSSLEVFVPLELELFKEASEPVQNKPKPIKGGLRMSKKPQKKSDNDSPLSGED